jgi:two-component system chemotaxis response regulator CheY
MWVLLVDDEQVCRRVIRGYLAQLGFESVDEACDGQEALSRLRTRKYDLIISDWNMEPMSGLELLQHIRADWRTRDMPFIMSTSDRKAVSVVAAKQAGVSNYIVKPFNVALLKKELEAVIGPL